MDISKEKLIKIYLLFIPVAYISYLFHELGHWIAGEVLGNDMVYSLNLVWPKSGHYISAWHNLYVLAGGPAFTILLALAALLVIEKFTTIYAYPFVFFQFVLRFFSLGFGGFAKQDEARIASILETGTYTIGIIVLLLLLLTVLRASYKLKINFKYNYYFFTVSILCQLMVIATYKLTGL